MTDVPQRNFRFVASCPDHVGIVARISQTLAAHGANITQSHQFEEVGSRRFLMRYGFHLPDRPEVVEGLTASLGAIAAELEMQWRLVDADRRQRVVILVSKFTHCLGYLMHRWRVGDLPFDLPCVISNHETARDFVEWHKVPFHHIPVPRDPAGKQAAFEAVAERIAAARPDTIVLARYMQVLPGWLCARHPHRIINIHHSFLPSFSGAMPYHQAKQRGVKLIGATSHYVTEDLDEGPIIDQDVVRIRHNDSVEDMMRLGKDVENVVLARGLRYHLEDRVLVQGNSTVLFC